MGGGGGDAPSAPNYEKLAREQGEQERKTAELVTGWNRPTQINPFGRMDWTRDANGNWIQTESWDPRLGAGAGSAMNLVQGRLGALEGQGAFNPTDTPEYDPNSGQYVGDALYRSVMDRVRPEQARDMERMSTKLRLQGLQPGSEAYDRAMQNLMTSQGDVSAQAALESKLAGGKESRDIYATQLAGQREGFSQDVKKYELPWDVAGAAQGLVAGSPRPNFADYGNAQGYSPANMVDAANRSYAAKMSGYSSDQAKKSSLLNTGGVIGAGMIPSDPRLKTNVVRIGTTPGGYPWYEFDYIWGEHSQGVMATEVPKEWTAVHPSGYLMVDYTKVH